MAIGDLEIELYRALRNNDEATKFCEKLPIEEGPLRVITIQNDSVLHVALYTKNVPLVNKLLDKFSKDHPLTTHQSDAGNTVLHEAATDNIFHSVAKRMLVLQPELLTQRNDDDETPLFSAARHGQMKMFKLLDDELQRTLEVEKAKEQHKKNDRTTILHAAIDAEHLELAFWIARKHEYLHDKKKFEGLTALQLLACNPVPFEFRGKGLLQRFIDSRIKSNNEDEDRTHRSYLQEGRATSRYSVRWWDEMVKKRKTYIAAVKLAELLIKTDELWRAKNKKDHKKSDDELKNVDEVKLLQKIEAQLKKKDEAELKKKEVEKRREERKQTPLFLATQTGCLEIVDEILKVQPQAVEQIDKRGRCILHIAIQYRQEKIFEKVEKNKFLMGRLVQNSDSERNSILHMVGKKIRNEVVEKIAQYSPCFQLQDDLILFERIKDAIPTRMHNHTNEDGQTAEELFSLKKEALRHKSQEWLKRMAESCSIVAILIATVAFAAAYTVPGGSNPDGSPVLLHQTFFGIFTIGDVLSLTFCLTSVIIFLWILSSSFQLQEFKYALPLKLMLGIICLLFSVTMMMLAFSATIILMIHHNEQWTKIALYAVALLPVTVLAAIYMPLFISLMPTLNYTLKKIRSYFPKKIEADDVEADHEVPVCYTTSSSTTAENSHSPV